MRSSVTLPGKMDAIMGTLLMKMGMSDFFLNSFLVSFLNQSAYNVGEGYIGVVGILTEAVGLVHHPPACLVVP